MLNALIVRLCQRCGLRRVSTVVPNARICDVCFLRAMQTLLAEPFPCPACGAPVTVPTDERFVCAVCHYVEEVEE